jgi:hypothetical protein
MPDIEALAEKSQALPVGRIAGFEDRVGFIAVRAQERSLARALAAASAASVAAVWNKPQDIACGAR